MDVSEEWTPPIYQRINVAELTPRTAPPYVALTHTERNSRYVLPAEDGQGHGKVLIGVLGVNYYEDGPADRDMVYLRRFDQPPTRGKRPRQ